MHPRTMLFAVVISSLNLPSMAAPPRLDWLFPAGAQRGQSVTVTAGGTFGQWPVKAWVNRPGLEIVATDEKGKLAVKAAVDAEPGVYWIRLYDDEGAAAPRPFVVGTLPELLETEPNDDRQQPQSLPAASVVVNGRLDKGADVDTFAVELRKGETLVASCEANRTLGSPVDANLQIVSSAGFVLVQEDDYHDLDPQIAFTAPDDGTFLVRAFGFPASPTATIGFAGGDDFIYRLTITTSGFVEYAYPVAVEFSERDTRTDETSQDKESMSVELRGWNLPSGELTGRIPPARVGESVTVSHPDCAGRAAVRIEPHAAIVELEPNGRDTPQQIALPVAITGRLDAARDEDVFGFQARKADKLVFRAEGRGLGFPIDPFLELMDRAGKTLAEVDDSGESRDSELAFEVPDDGEYRLLIRDLHGHGGERYVYLLGATLARPDFGLKLGADSFVVAAGEPLEIPVTIERLGGFAGEIEIVAEGLPEGAAAAPAKSLATGDSAKSVKLSLTAPGGAIAGAFRVVGRVTGEEQLTRTAQAPLANLNTTTADLWLTVLKQ